MGREPCEDRCCRSKPGAQIGSALRGHYPSLRRKQIRGNPPVTGYGRCAQECRRGQPVEADKGTSMFMLQSLPEEFSLNLEVAITRHILMPGLARNGKEQEGGITFFSGNTIDLTAAVRENLLAELPMKATCREDCRGLCPHCGHNLNLGECGCRCREVDPRLASLGKLLERE